MSYQDDLLRLGSEIFGCPHCREAGTCQRELADVSKGLYQHGPEISFVGENYGWPGLPRILFTRLNPTWNKDIGWFGTRESVAEYQSQNPGATTRDIFQCYLKGWKYGNKVYRGLWDAGTVTGHPNKSQRPGNDKRGSPRYGIQVIMEEMVRAGIFPAANDFPLQFCAINNAIKCAGSLPKWNPSTSMYKNCNHYEKELGILAPHILVAFGKDTDSYLRSKLHGRLFKVGNEDLVALPGGAKCRYFLLLHPLGQGKTTWRGDDVRHVRPAPGIDRDLGQKEKEQYKAGPGGHSTLALFKYVLYLVSEAKQLKDNLASW